LLTILILEDDDRLCQHWRSLLELKGYLVIVQSDTDGAIQSLNESKIDLVISDMIIRDQTNSIRSKGGLSLLAHIAMNLEPPAPKVLTVTGSNPELFLDKHAKAMQSDLCLRKPIADKELITAVETLLADDDE